MASTFILYIVLVNLLVAFVMNAFNAVNNEK